MSIAAEHVLTSYSERGTIKSESLPIRSTCIAIVYIDAYILQNIPILELYVRWDCIHINKDSCSDHESDFVSPTTILH